MHCPTNLVVVAALRELDGVFEELIPAELHYLPYLHNLHHLPYPHQLSSWNLLNTFFSVMNLVIIAALRELDGVFEELVPEERRDRDEDDRHGHRVHHPLRSKVDIFVLLRQNVNFRIVIQHTTP